MVEYTIQALFIIAVCLPLAGLLGCALGSGND